MYGAGLVRVSDAYWFRATHHALRPERGPLRVPHSPEWATEDVPPLP